MANSSFKINGGVVDNDFFLQYTSSEQNQITEAEQQVKRVKVQSYCLFLLASNDFTTLKNLLDGNIHFYQDIDTSSVLSNTLNRIIAICAQTEAKLTQQAIHHLTYLKDNEFVFIKDLFVEQIIQALHEGYSHKDVRYSQYFHCLLEMTKNVMLASPHYLPLLEDIPLDEINQIRKTVLHDNLHHDLAISSSQEKKTKL